MKRYKNIDENTFNIALNSFYTFLIKGGSLLISLLTTSSFIKYFDNSNVLGLWFTILSVLSWILTFDLGIGNGLRNLLVQPILEKKDKEIKKYISSAYIGVGLIVIVIYLGFVFTYKKINWNSFFNIDSSLISEDILRKTIYIVIVGILLQFFLKIITSVLYALQKAFLPNLLSLINSITIFIFVNIFFFESLDTRLITLALVYSLSVNLPLLISSIVVFNSVLKTSRPHINFYDKERFRDIITLGGQFFFVQLLYLLIVNTNDLLITKLYNPRYVVEYQLYNRIFSTFSSIFSILLVPMWSGITKALAEKNFFWIKSTYHTLLKLSAIAAMMNLLIIPFLQPVFNIWLGDNVVKINYYYAIVIALSNSIMIINSVLSTISNGLGEVKSQAILFSLVVIMKFPITIFLFKYYNNWITVILSFIISMIIYCAIQPFVINRIINSKKVIS